MFENKRNVLIGLVLILFAVNSGYSIKYAKTTMKKLVQTSTVIAKIKVMDKQSRWDDDHKKIHTFIDVQVIDVLKGTDVPARITVKQLGGRVGEQAMIVHGRAEFETDTEAVVFLVYDKGNYWVHSMGLGKFDIVTKDNRQIVQNDNIPSEVLVSDNLESLNGSKPHFRLDEFKTEINLLVK